VVRSTAAFWQAPTLADAAARVAAFDREALLLPLVVATQTAGRPARWLAPGTNRSSSPGVLRDALHGCWAAAVWPGAAGHGGLHRPLRRPAGHRLGHLPRADRHRGAGQITIDKVAGPVGEALIMTAAGLAVAIPAVLAYNVFGRMIGRIEADLEGFARDLRELAGSPRQAAARDMAFGRLERTKGTSP
jgi:biopolymer transport protein ExbB